VAEAVAEQQIAAAVEAGVTLAKAAPTKFAKSPAPAIKGKAKVGKTLRVKAKAWSPTPRLSYQWLRSGKKIAGATKATYTLRKADLGKRISVKVTAKRAGFATTIRTSAKTAKVK
jgi:hypothetical protein